MTQRDRDRLVVLKKAQKKLITQRQAAGELQLSERQCGACCRRDTSEHDGLVVQALRSIQGCLGGGSLHTAGRLAYAA